MPSGRKNRGSRHRSHKQHQKQKLDESVEYEIEPNLRHGPLPDSVSSPWSMEPLPARVEGPSVLKQDTESADSVPRGINRKSHQEAQKGFENVTGVQFSSKRKKGAIAVFVDADAATTTPSSLDRWDGGDSRADETLSLFDSARGDSQLLDFKSSKVDFDNPDLLGNSFGGQSSKEFKGEGDGRNRKGKARAALASGNRAITVIDTPGAGQVDASLGDTNIRIKNKVSRRRDFSELVEYEVDKSTPETETNPVDSSKGQTLGSNAVESGKANSRKGGSTRRWDKDVPRKESDAEAQLSSHPSDVDTIIESERKRGKTSDTGVNSSPKPRRTMEELSKSRKSEGSQKMSRKSEDVAKSVSRDDAEASDEHRNASGDAGKGSAGVEWVLQDDHRNLELEKELENRIRRRREESGDRDRWRDDDKEREGRRHHHQREDRYKDESRRRDEKHKDEKHREEKVKDDGTKVEKDRSDSRHRDENYKEVRNMEDKHKEERQKTDKDREERRKDDKEKDEKRKLDKDRDERNTDEKHKEDRHREDRHKDEKDRDDRQKEDKDGRRKDDKPRDGRYKVDKDREDRYKDEKDRDERLKDEKHKDERLRSEDRSERRRDDKDWGDRLQDEKDRSGRQRDKDDRLKDKDKDERYDKHKDEKPRDDKDRSDRHREETDRDGATRDEKRKDDKKKNDKDQDDGSRIDKIQDDRQRIEKQQDGKDKDGKEKDDRRRDDKDWDGKQREDRNKDEKLQDHKERDERHRDDLDKHDKYERVIDDRAKYERPKDDKDKHDRRKDDKDDRHRDDTARDERNRGDKDVLDKRKEFREKDDKHFDGSLRRERQKEDHHSEEKQRDERHGEDRQQDEKIKEDKHGEERVRSSERHDVRHLKEDGKQNEGWNRDGRHYDADRDYSSSHDEPVNQNKDYGEQVRPSRTREQDLRERKGFEKNIVHEGDRRGMKGPRDDAHDQDKAFPLPASSGVMDTFKGEHRLKRAREFGSADSVTAERDHARPRGRQAEVEGNDYPREDRVLRRSREERDSARSLDWPHDRLREPDDVRSKNRSDQRLDVHAAESRAKNIRSPQYDGRASPFVNRIDSSPKPNGWLSPYDAPPRSPSPSFLEGSHPPPYDKPARRNKFETSISVSSSSGTRRQRERNRHLTDHTDRVKQHYGMEEEVKSWEPRVSNRDSDDGRGRSLSPERNRDSLPSLPPMGSLASGQDDFPRGLMRGGYEESVVIEREHRRFSQGGGPSKARRLDEVFRERTEWVHQGLQMNRPPMGGPMVRPQLAALPNRLSGPSGLLPPPPPFRPGIDNPAILGAPSNVFEEGMGPRESGRYDRKTGGPYKRSEMVGLGDTWRGMGMGNWNTQNQGPGPSNMFSPFPPQVGGHPSGGFLGMGQQFPVPPLFGPGGARPSTDMGFGGARFHMGDGGGGFPGHGPNHGPVMGWHRPGELDESCCPPLPGPLDTWEGQGPYVDERQRYGRQEWDQGVPGMGGRGWDRVPELWQGQGGDAGSGFKPPHLQREASYQGSLGDEVSTARQEPQTNDQKVPPEDHSLEMLEGKESHEVSPAPLSESDVMTTVPLNEIKPSKRAGARMQMLLLNVDVSAELAGSDLYKQYLSLLPPSEAKIRVDIVSNFQDAFSESTDEDFESELDPEAQDLLSVPDLYSQFLPSLPESAFKEALEIYQRPVRENRVQKSAMGSFLLPVDSSLIKMPSMEAELSNERAEVERTVDQTCILNAGVVADEDPFTACNDDARDTTEEALSPCETVEVEEREQLQDNQRISPVEATGYVDTDAVEFDLVDSLERENAEDVGSIEQVGECGKDACKDEEMENCVNEAAPQTLPLVVNCSVHSEDPLVEVNSVLDAVSETQVQNSDTHWVEDIPSGVNYCHSPNHVDRINTEIDIALLATGLENISDTYLCDTDADSHAAQDAANDDWTMRPWDQNVDSHLAELLDDEASPLVEGGNSEGQLLEEDCAGTLLEDDRIEESVIRSEAARDYEIDDVKESVSNACMVYAITNCTNLLTSSPTVSILQC